MTEEDLKKAESFYSSRRPLFSSINVQTAIILLLTLNLCLLSPFPTLASENVTLNFVHDFIYGRLDRVQMANAKISSFIFLGLVFGPIKLIMSILNISSINVLLIMRLLLSLLTVSCWKFLQRRISFNYGSKVAFLFFMCEIFNWSSLDKTSRFLESTLIKSMLHLSMGFIIEKKYLMSLSILCLTLPVLREESLNFISSMLPLFLNRELFESDPLSLFSYMSIFGAILAINPEHASIRSVSYFSAQFIQNPANSATAISISIGLFFKNIAILKFAFVHLMGSYLLEKTLADPLFYSFASIAFALSISHFSSNSQKFVNHSIFESIGTKLAALFCGYIFFVNASRSTMSSPAGHSSMILNDFLQEDLETSSEKVKVYVSKSAQSLGFSKFLSMKHPRIEYEFRPITDEHEILQKFKYRVADIDESADPAYWRVRRVVKGFNNFEKEITPKLQVKILARAQAQ